jgi:hypothetical protein
MQSIDRYLVPDDRDFLAAYLPVPGSVTAPLNQRVMRGGVRKSADAI